MTNTNLLSRWLQDRSGAAAVELALVTPMLAVVLAGIATYAPELDKVHKMREAVSSGGLYVMTGVTDPTAIRNLALQAWTGRSDSDSITVTQWCACGGASGSCNTLCADNTVPRAYTQISAASRYTGVAGVQSLSAQQTVRTR
ncbi:MAG: pilus assembly protein [Proteobacteria bacterium]|nr:pilus assembly protein [Pseudomonadota bacterium]